MSDETLPSYDVPTVTADARALLAGGHRGGEGAHREARGPLRPPRRARQADPGAVAGGVVRDRRNPSTSPTGTRIGSASTRPSSWRRCRTRGTTTPSAASSANGTRPAKPCGAIRTTPTRTTRTAGFVGRRSTHGRHVRSARRSVPRRPGAHGTRRRHSSPSYAPPSMPSCGW